MIQNHVDPEPLCPHCFEWPKTWLECPKARLLKNEFDELALICPDYKGDMKYYNWNIKIVSLSEFFAYASHGDFHRAKRLRILVRDAFDPWAERLRIKEWIEAREALR